MAPKKKITTEEALEALANQAANGPLTERGEFVMDATMSTALDCLSAELGGRGARGKAMRLMMQKGAIQLLVERAPAA